MKNIKHITMFIKTPYWLKFYNVAEIYINLIDYEVYTKSCSLTFISWSFRKFINLENLPQSA